MSTKKRIDNTIRVDPEFRKMLIEDSDARVREGVDSVRELKSTRRLTKAIMNWEGLPELRKALKTRRMDNE